MIFRPIKNEMNNKQTNGRPKQNSNILLEIPKLFIHSKIPIAFVEYVALHVTRKFNNKQ